VRTTLTRILAAITLAALSVGPVSAATATSAATAVAQAATTSTVSGTVRESSGAVVAGAHVELRGPQTYTATTDAKGAFSVADVAQGIYSLSVTKPGYQIATEDDFTVVAGTNQTVQIALQPQTFTSLRTIATVHANGRAQFNTSTASVNVVTAQDLQDQGQPQVGRILNQIPGVQNSLPTSSANGAVAGAITVPNIRGALSFETASLIDGHPLAVGDFGDYVTTFLNSYLLGSVEVVKGPGAASPQTNYAIGGTVNFRTKDPTLTPTPEYTIGFTNRGGSYYNFGISDTLGRLGFVVDIAGDNEVPALNGYRSYFNISQGNSAVINGKTVPYNDTATQVPGTNSFIYNQYSLVGCCYQYNGDLNGTGELIKLRYKLSNATTATVSYLGSQYYADQNANTSELIPSTFTPGAGYTGSLAPNSSLLIPNAVYPVDAREINNEPIFQAEVRSLVGNDTVLARYYHASIDRLIYEGNPNPSVPVTAYYNLYGTAGGQTYNGGYTPVQFYDWYNQFEEDRLSGLSFEYQHPYSDGDALTFSVDQNRASSTAGSWGTSKSGNTYVQGTPSVSNPDGTSQIFTTLVLRNDYQISSKLSSVLALYDNLYRNTFPTACTGSCKIDGSNALFTTNNTSHFDERIGLTYRPSQIVSIRAAAGSAIAPPYLSLLSKVTTAPTKACSGVTACVFNVNNPGLVPETAFGYDLGADVRLPANLGVLSVDGYLTNLYNHFLSEQIYAGQCGSSAVYVCPSGSAATAPIFLAKNTNLNNARFEGVEVSWKKATTQGLGWDVAGAIQHAYAYNLPAGFYCQGLAPGTPCTPANYNVNLPIIAGHNFTGNTFSAFTTGLSGQNVGASGFSNTAIPYLQGDATVNYTFKDGIYAELGETLYGKNNGYNLPPFGIGHASIRIPINSSVSFQASGDNIFNAWTGDFPIVGGGIAYPLANGTLGATIGNVVGPATYRFELTKTLP
jgi:outer membrane receptor protein involved in Fe transport